MIVVSDTTPLNYLILTETVHVLPAIFGRVYVPSAVIKELLHPRRPQAVGTWASSPPEWLTVQDPTHTGAWKLGRGETAAISLALELKADRALIDDRDGSREATRSGLKVVGTLGILEEAAKRGLIDIEQTRPVRETEAVSGHGHVWPRTPSKGASRGRLRGVGPDPRGPLARSRKGFSLRDQAVIGRIAWNNNVKAQGGTVDTHPDSDCPGHDTAGSRFPRVPGSMRRYHVRPPR